MSQQSALSGEKMIQVIKYLLAEVEPVVGVRGKWKAVASRLAQCGIEDAKNPGAFKKIKTAYHHSPHHVEPLPRHWDIKSELLAMGFSWVPPVHVPTPSMAPQAALCTTELFKPFTEALQGLRKEVGELRRMVKKDQKQSGRQATGDDLVTGLKEIGDSSSQGSEEEEPGDGEPSVPRRSHEGVPPCSPVKAASLTSRVSSIARPIFTFSFITAAQAKAEGSHCRIV